MVETSLLLLGVGLLTILIGTGSAWIVTVYQFHGRAFLDWALLLPLAVPTYIIAYSYIDILHPIGPALKPAARRVGVRHATAMVP